MCTLKISYIIIQASLAMPKLQKAYKETTCKSHHSMQLNEIFKKKYPLKQWFVKL